MEEKDLYAILGVGRGASADEIRTAYRKLARQHHPDVNPNDPKAEDRFKEVSFAYDVLSDATKRAADLLRAAVANAGIVSVGRTTDELRRVDGTWRIAHRSFAADGS